MKELNDMYTAAKRLATVGFTVKEANDNVIRNMRLITYNELRKQKIALINRIIDG